MMKRETLLDWRRPISKMDYHGPDVNNYKQVIDSHLEALSEIDRLNQTIEGLRADAFDLSSWGENGAQG